VNQQQQLGMGWSNGTIIGKGMLTQAKIRLHLVIQCRIRCCQRVGHRLLSARSTPTAHLMEPPIRT
jgi:hypothetical protein